MRRPDAARRRAMLIAACGLVLLAVPAWRMYSATVAARAVPHLPERARARAVDARPCPDLAHARVLLVLGQSNAGNHGETAARAERGVVWWDGSCYAVADPLPGATGDGGSIWSRFASDERAPDRPLVLVLLAVDATTIADWSGDASPLRATLQALLGQLARQRVQPTAVLWQQGESDGRRGTTGDAYAAGFARLVAQLRDAGVAAPVFFARSTRCRSEPYAPVREAAARATQTMRDVRLGPDLDVIGADQRFDGCHFGTAALARAAQLWRASLDGQVGAGTP